MTNPQDHNSQHWAQVGEAGATAGMKFLFWVYRWLGRIPFRIALFPVILYFFAGRRSAREASLQYLQYLQDADHYQPHHGRLYDSFRHFLSFGESLLDKLAVWQGDIGLDAIRFHGHECVDRLAREGRGALMIGSHLGNLEICRALAQRNTNLTMNVLMHTAHAAKFNSMLKKAGSNSQMNIIQVTEMGPATAMMLQEKLDRGEFIVIAGDRIPVSGGKNTTRANFLGHPCDFPSGPFILASILRCPMLSIFCLRDTSSRKPRWNLHMELLEERVVLPRARRQQQLAIYVQQWADSLTHFCRLAPLQWYNFYPFWQLQNADAESTSPTP